MVLLHLVLNKENKAEQLFVYNIGLCVQCVCTATMYRLLETIKMYVLPFISSKSVFVLIVSIL